MKFYRVCNPATEQGLWYHFDGSFSGLIHNDFNFCVNAALKMDYDEELVGWLSATDSLETLCNWFTQADIKKLQEYGWYIHVYETDDWKFYEKFQHQVINQNTSKLIEKITI